MTSNGATTSIRKRNALSSPIHSQRCLRTSSKPARNSARKLAPLAPGAERTLERPDAGGADQERAGVEHHRTTRRDETHEDAAERRADAERDAARDAEQRVGLLQPACGATCGTSAVAAGMKNADAVACSA